MIPIVIIVAVFALYFLYAMRWGIVNLLSSAIALAAGLGVFFTGLNMGPPFMDESFGILPPWQFLVVGAGVLAAVIYLIVWLISRGILKFLFNPDSFLHFLVDGVPGGILSIGATVVTVFFIFTGIRIAGTIYELDYAATIAQPEIVNMDYSKLPEPAVATQWRDQIEQLPYLAEWLDFCDPFSRRQNRNLGIVSLFAATQISMDFSEDSEQMAAILSNRKVDEWITSEEMAGYLNLKDKISMVMSLEAIRIANHSELKNRLIKFNLQRHIREFVQFLQTNQTL